MPRLLPVIAACTAALIATASPARADDASYLAGLQAHGVPTGWPFTPIPAGYTICGQLRNGMAPENATNQFGWMNGLGPEIVAAAQHNLSPDTLH